MPPKPAKGRPSAAPPTRKPAPPPPCGMCSALKNAYPDVPPEVIRKHCAAHPVTDDAMTQDPLPLGTHHTIKPYEPERLPDDYRPFVDSWDGQIRPVWASANLRTPPPQSPAWEHLIEWAAEVRRTHRRLTVGATALLLRQHLHTDEDAIRRLLAIYADEYAAEKRFRKSGETPTAATLPPPPPPALVVPKPAVPKEVVTDTTVQVPAKKPKVVVQQEGRDEWGYKFGTRSQVINAYLKAHPKDWLTAREVEKATKTTSASSHLSSLVRDGHAEYRRPEGSREGQYRLKAKK